MYDINLYFSVKGNWRLLIDGDQAVNSTHGNNTFMMSPSSPNFVVRARLLCEGVKYTLELTTHYEGQPKRKTRFHLERKTAVVPYGGTCSIS